MTSSTSRLSTWLIAVSGAIGLQSAFAQAPALRTEITYTDDRRQIGFLLNSNEQGILFTLNEGTPGQPIAYSSLTAIVFPDAAQITQAAKSAYLAGDFETAAEGMAQIADTFPQAAAVPGNFATEARFYHVDALRQLGRYDEIGRLFATPTGAAMESTLGEVFQRQVALLKLWAYFGAGNTAQLGTEIEAYLQPQVGNDAMLPDQKFRDGIPEHDLTQLCFLRAKVHEAANRKPQALDDYYRTIALAQANQPVLAKQAMTAAMALHAADPAIDARDSSKWPLQGLAYTFKNAFNKGEIDSEFSEFAVLPDLPVAPAAPQEPEEEPATEPPAADMPADSDKGKSDGDADGKAAPKAKAKAKEGESSKAKAKE